jgi:hypothetical protein
VQSARCIELYRADDVEYLCPRKERKVQTCIQRPTGSRLPAQPHEVHELHEESLRMSMAPASKNVFHDDAIFEEDAEWPGTFSEIYRNGRSGR